MVGHSRFKNDAGRFFSTHVPSHLDQMSEMLC